MSMTKKDYEVIAKAIKKQWDVQVEITGTGDKSMAIHETALRIATGLGHDNPKFDYNKFLNACGVK